MKEPALQIYCRVGLIAIARNPAENKSALAKRSGLGINTVRKLWTNNFDRINRQTVETLSSLLMCDFGDLFVLKEVVPVSNQGAVPDLLVPQIHPPNPELSFRHRLICNLAKVATASDLGRLEKTRKIDPRGLQLLVENQFSLVHTRTVSNICEELGCELFDLFSLEPKKGGLENA